VTTPHEFVDKVALVVVLVPLSIGAVTVPSILRANSVICGLGSIVSGMISFPLICTSLGVANATMTIATNKKKLIGRAYLITYLTER
jgi:hypothetical protein